MDVLNRYFFKFADGQGVGNQLWCYLSLKSIFHERKGELYFTGYTEFKVIELFPEKNFISDFIEDINDPDFIINESIRYAHKGDFPVYEDILRKIDLLESKENERVIEIKGLMQRMSYLNSLSFLKNLLHIKCATNLSIDEDVCVIHLRGGDYLGSAALLPASYFRKSISIMEKMYNIKKFKIVTNDINYARKVLPNCEIIGSGVSVYKVEETNATHHIGGSILQDYKILNNAKYVILTNSTFSFWPVYLSCQRPKVIAPMHWFSYNISDSWWSPCDSIVPEWQYLSKNFRFEHGRRMKNMGCTRYDFLVVKYKMIFVKLMIRVRRKIYVYLKWTDLKK